MNVGSRITCIFLSVLVQAFAIQVPLSSRQCSANETFDVMYNDEYLVKWDGYAISRRCYMRFKNKNSSYRKLCIQAQSFNVRDCGVNIRYYSGVNADTLQKAYGCDDIPSEYCGNVYYDVSITVDVTGVRRNGGDSFTLKVYSKSVSSKNSNGDQYFGGIGIGGNDASDKDTSSTKDDSESSDGISIGAGTGTTLLIVGAVIMGVYFIRKRRQTTHTTTVSGQQQAPTVVNINSTPAYAPTYPQSQPAIQTQYQYHQGAPQYYPQNHQQAMPSAPPR